MKKLLMTGVALATLAGAALTTAQMAQAEDTLFIPSLSYRTGPFASGGVPLANGFADYFAMLNERDGGIGGAKVVLEECETGYNAQKGVECYESTKGKGALVYGPYSTGITLQLIPKAPVDKIPILSMGYGLSAVAVGEKFPWTFNYPTSYWSQMTAILKYVESDLGDLKGKKIGYIYLDAGYGTEPIPLLDQLAKDKGFEVVKFPVGVKEMQSQGSQWLNVRKEKPDYMIMWGWGAMNATAVKEAAKIKYPLDKFIGNWWAGSHADMRPLGEEGKGYKAANFSGIGTTFPALQDVIKYVVDTGKSQAPKENVGDVLYNRGLFNAVLIAEAIQAAQKETGKKSITGEDMRKGLETFDLTAARMKEIGLEGFTAEIKGSCKDHEGSGGVFMMQWDGKDWAKITDPIAPDAAIVRPLLEAAAADYLKDKPDWQTQTCGS
jgi:branched-chain amino acid transport system substrate-binding protein